MKMLSKKAVARLLNISPVTVDFKRKHDRYFPRPYRLGKSLRWRSTDFQQEQTKVIQDFFIRDELCELFSIQKVTLRRLEQVEGFPKPVEKRGRFDLFDAKSVYEFIDKQRINYEKE